MLGNVSLQLLACSRASEEVCFLSEPVVAATVRAYRIWHVQVCTGIPWLVDGQHTLLHSCMQTCVCGTNGWTRTPLAVSIFLWCDYVSMLCQHLFMVWLTMLDIILMSVKSLDLGWNFCTPICHKLAEDGAFTKIIATTLSVPLIDKQSDHYRFSYTYQYSACRKHSSALPLQKCWVLNWWY